MSEVGEGSLASEIGTILELLLSQTQQNEDFIRKRRHEGANNDGRGNAG